MVIMSVLLCTPNVLQLEHCVSKLSVSAGRLAPGKERTMPTLNTAVVFLLIIYLHPDGVMRVSWEPGATDDPFAVLPTPKKNQQTPSISQPAPRT
jgi:hypothetical protein